MNASLIDGFVYRMPFEFSVKDGVKLSDLNGQTVCQCASLQLDKGSVGESSNNVRGSILLRPNKVPLEQTLRLYGTLPGEFEATELGRVKVACKVFAPLRLQPAWIEVSEKNPFPETIKLQLSHGVEIQEANMQDGHSLIGGKYDKEASLFRLELPKGETPTGSAWLNRDGNLLFRFKIAYQKMQSEYEVVVPYGPPRPTRVAPENVIFRQDRDATVYVGRLFILGLQSEARPELVIEFRVDGAAWVRSDSEFVIDSFTRGRASGHITIPRDKIFLSRESKTRLRLIDKGTEKSIAEFNGSLLE